LSETIAISSFTLRGYFAGFVTLQTSVGGILMNKVERQRFAVIPPYVWMGEWDCLVGPFQREEMALFFVEHVLTPSDEPHRAKVYQHEDGWYIDARRYSGQIITEQPVEKPIAV
jgi:hypothetical protein